MNGCNDKRRCDRLLVIHRDLRDNAGDRLHLTRTRIATRRTIRQANALRINLRIKDDLTLIKNVLVSRKNFRLPLRRTIKVMLRPLLLTTLQMRFCRITNGVLCLHLDTIFRLLPNSNTGLIRAKHFALLSLMLKGLIREISKSGRRVFILVSGLRRLLHNIAIKSACRSNGAPRAVINVRRVIAKNRLIRLLRTRNRLTTTYLITLRIVLIGTIRRLVINGSTSARDIINGTFIRHPFRNNGKCIISAILGSNASTIDLFRTITTCMSNMIAKRMFTRALYRRIRIFVRSELCHDVRQSNDVQHSNKLIARLRPTRVRNTRNRLTAVGRLTFRHSNSVLLQLANNSNL